MWAFRAIRLFAKSLLRIAIALETLVSLYKLDLASRGITPTTPGIKDEVEVAYGWSPTEDE